MNIHYNLVYPGKDVSPIRVVVTHRGKTYRKSVGLSCQTKFFKKEKTGNPSLDRQLKIIRMGLEEVLDDMSTEYNIESALERISEGQWLETATKVIKGRPRFFDFFREWSERPSGAKRQNQLVYRNVKTLMGEACNWDDIDSAFYVKLLRKFDERGWRPNYQGVMIGRLKTVLNEGYALHYIDNDDFMKWKKPSEETFAVALNEKEVDAIWNADLPKDSMLARTRDLFMLGILTAARFSDYSRLTTDNVKGDRLDFVQTKTGGQVLIPCSPKIKTILVRNGGRAPRVEQQVFNRNLKELCKKLGFTDVVEVPDTIRQKLKKPEGASVHKYELISTHCARRTGATLLYKQGVPAKVVRYLTGHKDDETLMRYLKIDKDEAADILSKSEFFK